MTLVRGRHTAWGVALAVAAVTVAGAAAAQGYDKKFSNDFTLSCVRGGGNFTVCECTLSQIKAQIPFQTFAKLQDSAPGGKADKTVLDRYDKIVRDCVKRGG
jgi:hypothetical protein